MDQLPINILIEIFLFCKTADIITILQVNKSLYNILTQGNFCWLKYMKIMSPCTFFLEKIWINSTINSFKLSDLKKYWNAASNPKSIIESPVESSSQDRDQDIACTMLYDNGRFWSSEPSETDDTNDYLIYKLKSKCFVFSVHFKVHRVLYQNGTIYPPKTAKVKIGNFIDNYHYESEKFEVSLTERYNTILILPNFIEGEYVRIDLYGKQMREPRTELYYSVISFVDIIGFPLEKLSNIYEITDEGNLDIEDIIKYKNTDVLSNTQFTRTPFLYERMIKHKKITGIYHELNHDNINEIEKYLMVVNRMQNYFADIYYLTVNKTIELYFADIRMLPYNELIAQFFYDIGEIWVARELFYMSKDYWGECKVLILLGDFNTLTKFILYNSPRIPQFNDILKYAKELGPLYEAQVKANLGHLN